MEWKRIAKALLFPKKAIMILLIPFSTAFLVFSMVFLGTESIPSYVSYVISAYTLTVWCFKIPDIISFFKKFREENRYIQIWRANPRLRVKVSLYSSLIWNTVYAVFQLWLGFYHNTFWFYSIGGYYICLALRRLFLVKHTRRYAPRERMKNELVKYRACGWIFLVMNLALALIVFFMIYWNRTFKHHMITAIAMAAYTFTSFTVNIVNLVKYKKYNSPVFSATKAISFAAACVSMLTLTSTMLTTFSDETLNPSSQKFMLGSVGFAVSGVVVFMAIYMIVQGTKKIKQLKKEVQNAEQ